MFMAEKFIEIPFENLDILAAENRSKSYLKLNPSGQMPALKLDDGTVIAETVAICEYLEETHTFPALIGTNAKERAATRMWMRRVELNITESKYAAFRFAEGYGLFKDRIHCIPSAANDLKMIGQEKLIWLDGLMSGRSYIVDDQLRLPDIALYCCLDFCKDVGQPLDLSLKNIGAWFKRVDLRPSAQSSLSYGWDLLKMRG